MAVESVARRLKITRGSQNNMQNPEEKLTNVSVVVDAAKEAVELEKRYIPIGYNIDSVNQVASEILAAQLEGAATSLKQLRDACANAPALMKRLATQNVNTTFITETICNAAKKHALPINSDVLNKTIEARSLLWAVQVIPAAGYNFNKLCNLIDIEGANQIGLGK